MLYLFFMNSFNLISNSDIQINSVESFMDERKEHLFKKPINEQILKFYR